ncbi:YIP1 family protein [Natrialbaceae archaeon A-CW1-1]
MIEHLVTQPRYFFKEQTKYPGARTQMLLVLAVGIAFGLAHVSIYYQMGEEAAQYYEVIAIYTSVNVAVPFLIWIGSTILMAILSRFISRGLLIGELFRLTGWGMYPLLAAGLIQSAARVYALEGSEPPELGLTPHLSHTWDQYRLYLETANGDPVFLVTTGIAVALALYAGYLWMIAVEELAAFDETTIARPKAAIIAAIPTVLCLIWIVAPFVF